MKTETLLNAAVIVLVVCAVVVTGLVVRRSLRSPRSGPAATSSVRLAELRLGTVEKWRQYAKGGHRMGSREAPVTVVEFGDFQCPHCRTLARSLDSLRRMFPERVAVVYRHYPLPGHDAALSAARASECAGDQGAFRAFYRVVYRRQASLGTVPMTEYADAAGVDLAAFEACMASGAPDRAIRRDTLAARRLGISATPTMLVNGTLVEGAVPVDALATLVERATAE